MSRIAWRSAVIWLVLLLLPSVTHAQSAAITGVVKDASGGVLPGVTVETASPALIEKTRSVVSDGSGQYRIVALPPGTYSVSFTLPGFSTVKRDGIELTGSFVATVNADLRVGSLEETITVSGETPIVDVQSVRQQKTLDKDTIAAIPTSRLIGAILNLIPGITGPDRDVGGAKGVTTQATWGGSIHGGKATEGRMLADGFQATYNNSGGGLYMANTGTAQEVVVSTSGNLGEAETGGVLTNVIPREGGNNFTGMIFYSGANDKMQGSNYSQSLKDQGLTTPPNEIIKVYDFNPAGGGRIIRDRLWFYLTFRTITAHNTVPGMYYNKNAGNPDAWTYEPDLNRRAFYDNRYGNASGRLTWQASPRNKFAAFWDQQWKCEKCIGGGTAVIAPEANDRGINGPGAVVQGTWSSPISNRILAEAGFGMWELRWPHAPRDDGSFNPQMIAVTDQAGSIPGLSFRAPSGGYSYSTVGNHTWRASVSYVTGAHNAKFGYFGGYTNPTTDDYWFTDVSAYRFSGGVPNQFTIRGANPTVQQRNLIPTAFYAQDQWTVRRFTLQGGVRYDYQLTSFGEFTTSFTKRIGTSRLINPAIVYPAGSVDGVHHHDITPRMGVAYDVFGNGKTALRANLGKFPMAQTGTGTMDLAPSARLAISATRSWTDSNKNYVPDCDLSNNAKNLECGAVSNANFGKNVFSNTWDPAIVNGWGVRPYQWEGSVSVQHEVLPRVSVNVGYFRRWYGNFNVTDNRLLAPSDFDKFSVVVAPDPRLPDGGGQTIAELYDVKQAKFGLTDDYRTAAKNFGDQIENWQGMDVIVNARPRTGLSVQGGMSTGRTLTDNCEIRAKLPEIAQTNPNCRVETPYLTQVRGFGSYTFPWQEIQVSGSWQSNPGIQLAANRNVPSAQAALSLGRQLSGGATSVSVNYVTPGTLYSDQINQVDLRVAKVFRFDRRRIQVGLDLYNATNTSVPLAFNQTYVPGGSWLVPTEILPARFIKFSLQADF